MYASLGLNELMQHSLCKKDKLFIVTQMSRESCQKGPYPSCIRMADRALLAGYSRCVSLPVVQMHGCFRIWLIYASHVRTWQLNGAPGELQDGVSWWRHQMETFSALLALCAGNSPVTGEFAAQRPVTRSFEVSFDLCLNKRLSKQSWGWWFETPSRSLWRHRNVFDQNIVQQNVFITSYFTHVYTGLTSFGLYQHLWVNSYALNVREIPNHNVNHHLVLLFSGLSVW